MSRMTRKFKILETSTNKLKGFYSTAFHIVYDIHDAIYILEHICHNPSYYTIDELKSVPYR